MQTFQDSKGRAWEIRIDVLALRRVRASTKIELTDLFTDDSIVAMLLSDFVSIGEVLFAIVRPQADAQRIGEEQFLTELETDELLAAGEIILRELANFFPKDRRAVAVQAVESVIRARGAAGSKALTEANLRLAQLGETLNGIFSNSPESSGSTPALSPSANST